LERFLTPFRAHGIAEGFVKRVRDARLPVRACLLASAIFTAIPARDKQTSSDDRQNLTDDDRQILEVVLLDLIDFDEFNPWPGPGKKTSIVLYQETAGLSGFLSDDQLDADSDGTNQVPGFLRADLRRRNSGEPVSLRRLKPSSPRILVGDLSGLSWFGDFETRYPQARGYVEPWLPGYSKDGETAVLRACVGPTPHGATTTYLLTKKRGRWTVVWRTVAYYA
jgi:hypothetical protein